MAEFQRARDPTAGVMMREEVSERAGGFSFENTLRNDLMARAAGRGETVQTSAKKTGTTICGVTFKNGVVLGADTRATGGSEICDKNCEKIHYIAPNIFCCGAGTAADTEKTTEMIASQLELARLNAGGVESRTVTACTLLKRMLFRYQGHISAALVLGGVDAMGVHLYDVYPHGSTSKLPYVSMGSGSLAAMSVLEMKYKEDMEEAEAIAVVKDAIMAGIMNDLGSGSNVDVTVIRKDKLPSGERSVEQFRGLEKPNEVAEVRARINRPDKLRVAPGGTATLTSTFTPAAEPLVVEDAEAMQL